MQGFEDHEPVDHSSTPSGQGFPGPGPLGTAVDPTQELSIAHSESSGSAVHAPAEGSEISPQAQDAIQVIEFLREFKRLREQPIRSLDRYERILWAADLPNNPAISGQAVGHDVAEWLTVKKLREDLPPEVPASLKPYLDAKSVKAPAPEPPTLKLPGMNDHAPTNQRLDAEEVRNLEYAYSAWVPAWSAWATATIEIRRVMDVYHKLYQMHEDFKLRADSLDFVVGAGLLKTQSGGHAVKRHLLTFRMNIQLDLSTGRLSVVPDSAAPMGVLEEDMLDAKDMVQLEIRKKIEGQLEEVESPWHADSVQSALLPWVHSQGANADLSMDRRKDATTLVSYAPAIMVRQRNDRAVGVAAEQMINHLKGGGALPPGFARFVSTADDTLMAPHEVDIDLTGGSTEAGAETYFPKPANEQQRQIVQRLRQSDVVVVQGPPGTGKTHTIANLVTHLLAEGKRVLVTSEKARALHVLKGQLPEHMRDLCVSMTEEAAAGQRDLERSIGTIRDTRDNTDLGNLRREVETLQANLRQARSTRASAEQELRDLRSSEWKVYQPTVGDYAGTLQQIAARVHSESDAFAWIGTAPGESPTVSANSVLEFVELCAGFTPQVQQLVQTAPSPGDVLPPDEFQRLAQQRQEFLGDARFDAGRGDTPLGAELAKWDLEQLELLRQQIAHVTPAQATRSTSQSPALATVVRDIAQGQVQRWSQWSEQAEGFMRQLEENYRQLSGIAITGMEAFGTDEALAQLTAIHEHLLAGGKFKNLIGRSRVIKDADDILVRGRVNGSEIDTLEEVEQVIAYLKCRQALDRTEQLRGLQPSPGSVESRRLDFTETLRWMAQMVAAGKVLQEIAQQFSALDMATPVNAYTPEGFAQIKEAVDHVVMAKRAHSLSAALEPTLALLNASASRGDAAACVAAATEAIQRWDTSVYRAATEEMAAHQRARQHLTELSSARAALQAQLPQLAANIEANPDIDSWSTRLERLDEAWQWSYWDQYLQRMSAPDAERDAERQARNAEAQERHTLGELAAKLGWLNAMQRLTNREMTELQLYMQAVQKVGKGTGKSAARYRADARRHLEQCQSAVPAWIMPMRRVFEMIGFARPGIFDVIIVDEASQSTLDALLLSWLASSMVVVGDDKQVSPTVTGLRDEEVVELRNRFVGHLPHASLFDRQSSFFDAANSMATGSKIMLLEHFRCMPEIIEFSNSLYYHGRLQALKQFMPDRLPPLRSTFVPGAFVKSVGTNDVNEVEAEALVQQIQACLADPAYEGKSMGVITLLGKPQADLISRMLTERLEAAEREARELRVGTAEDFQGDERDIIFFTIVTAQFNVNGEKQAGMGWSEKKDLQQRINVAASRAREQVWAFHSSHIDEMRAGDLRRQYLEYLNAPRVEAIDADIGEVSEDDLRPPFDSIFEQRVYRRIRQRGFSVQPQVKVGRFRIDLVISGGTRKLAVECDGERFHGADQEDDDIARQRDLERVGWTFWRVRGSAFFRDPEASLESLWQTLADMGIEPMQAGGVRLPQPRAEVLSPPSVELPQQPVMAAPTSVPSPVPAWASAAAPVSTSPAPAIPAPADMPAPEPFSPAPIETPEHSASLPPVPAAAFEQEPPRARALSSSARERITMEHGQLTQQLAKMPDFLRDERHGRISQRVAQLEALLEGRADTGSDVVPRVHAASAIWLATSPNSDGARCALSSMELSGWNIIDPDSYLGRGLIGQEVGAQVPYEENRPHLMAYLTKIED